MVACRGTANYTDTADIQELSMQIEIGSFVVLPNDALPFQSGAFEIQQESQFEATDCKVSDHLRDMRLTS